MGYLDEQYKKTRPGGSAGGGFGFSGNKSGALGEYDYVGKGIDTLNPYTKSNKDVAKEAAAEAEQNRLREQQYKSNKGIVGYLDSADDNYYQKMDKSNKLYQYDRDSQYRDITGDINALSDQAKSQASDATQTYTNDIRPNQKKLMEQQMGYANDAMSLQEAGDPNNQIQTAVRGMYDERAAGARKQGISDFGVLSAMGAQSAAGQMGNVPMTAGSMSNIYAANQSQAGEAVARSQQKVDRLQEQGIDRAFDESDRQYGRGERERDRASGRISDFQSGEERYMDGQARFRGEIGGYDSDLYGLGMGRVADDARITQGMAGLSRDTAYGKSGRKTALSDQLYGGQQQALSNQMAAQQADRAGQQQMMGSMIQGGATIVGGMYGGPGGAAAANQGAGAITNGLQNSSGNNRGGGTYQGGYGGSNPYSGYNGNNPSNQRRYTG